MRTNPYANLSPRQAELLRHTLTPWANGTIDPEAWADIPLEDLGEAYRAQTRRSLRLLDRAHPPAGRRCAVARTSNGPTWNPEKGRYFANVGNKRINLRTDDHAEAVKRYFRVRAGLPAVEPAAAAGDTHASAKVTATAPPAKGKTLAELLPDFIADRDRRKRAEATIKAYRRDVGAFLIAGFGAKLPAEVTGKQIGDWLYGLDVSDTTKGIMFRGVRAFFGWLTDVEEVLVKNPCKSVPVPPSTPRGEQAQATPEQFAALCAAATPELRDFLTVMKGTGCRPDEACKITGANFTDDGKDGIVHLDIHKNKSKGKVRMFPVVGEALEVLRRLKAKRGAGQLLWSRKNVPYRSETAGEGLNRLRKAVGITEDVVNYGFRSLFITDALRANVSIEWVAAACGTSADVIQRNYWKLIKSADELKDVAKKVQEKRRADAVA